MSSPRHTDMIERVFDFRLERNRATTKVTSIVPLAAARTLTYSCPPRFTLGGQAGRLSATSARSDYLLRACVRIYQSVQPAWR
jgi:hypothetical protein